MRPSSLPERLRLLESDLLADPPRISAYSDLPCALFRYDPTAEWDMRGELRKLKTRLENAGKRVHLVSLAEFLWEAIDKSEGLAPVVQLERERGWEAAQEQVAAYLSGQVVFHLPSAILDRLSALDPKRDIGLVWRDGALAPGFYLLSKLVNEWTGKLSVPTVLFFPGTAEAGELRFMGLVGRESAHSYRVKTYV